MNINEQKIRHIIHQIREEKEPSVILVHQLLQSLHLFHIYDLETALTALDSRVKNAALKKVEEYLPALTSDDSKQQKSGILALEHHFERIKMLDEDA